MRTKALKLVSGFIVIALALAVATVVLDNNEVSDAATGIGTIDDLETEMKKSSFDITLTADLLNVTLDNPIVVTGTGTLDFNGHTISVTKVTSAASLETNQTDSQPGNKSFIVNKGSGLILKNSAVNGGITINSSDGQTGAITNIVGGIVTIESGTYTSTTTGDNQYKWYLIKNMGTMTVNDGTFTGVTHYSDVSKKNASSMFVNGWYTGTNNTGKKLSVLTINGGTFTGGLNSIKNDDWSKAVIKGGEFSNTLQNTIMNWNELEIQGGTFNVNSSYYVLENDSDDGHNEDTYYQKGSTEISGGTFNGDILVYSSKQAKRASLEITGGTFNGNLYPYVNTDLAISGCTLNGNINLYSNATMKIPYGKTFTIKESRTLTVYSNSTVTIVGTLINSGSIVNNGEIVLDKAMIQNTGGTITSTAASPYGLITGSGDSRPSYPDACMITMVSGTIEKQTIKPTSSHTVSYVMVASSGHGFTLSKVAFDLTEKSPAVIIYSNQANAQRTFTDITFKYPSGDNTSEGIALAVLDNQKVSMSNFTVTGNRAMDVRIFGDSGAQSQVSVSNIVIPSDKGMKVFIGNETQREYIINNTISADVVDFASTSSIDVRGQLTIGTSMTINTGNVVKTSGSGKIVNHGAVTNAGTITNDSIFWSDTTITGKGTIGGNNEVQYLVTPSAGEGGTISPTTTFYLAEGTAINKTAAQPISGNDLKATAGDGKRFGSWTLSPDSDTMPAGPLTMTATFVGQGTATFDLKGGSVASTPGGWTALTGADAGKYTKVFDVGTTNEAIISDFGDNYSRTGYTKGNPTSTADTMTEAGMTISATWTANTYNVTFVGNFEGSTYRETISETYASAYTLPSVDPVREGYTFAGWFDLAEGGNQIGSSTIVEITSAQTVFAHWDTAPVSKLSVTFVSNNLTYRILYVDEGSTVMKIAAPSGSEESAFIPENSKFVGWMTTNGGSTRFDFSTPIVQDTNIYAKWSNQTVVTLPEAGDAVGYTITTNSQLTGDYNRSFTMTITPAEGYTISSVWAIADITSQQGTTGGDYTFNVTADCSVYVEVIETATGKQTETAKTVVENDDSSTTTIKTTIETENGSKTITESASKTAGTTGASESTTTAKVTDTSAVVTINTTDDDVSTVSETLVDAIKEAAGTGTVSIDLTVSTPAVVIPKTVMNNNIISEVTVTVNQGSSNSAAITIPSNALAGADIGETFSVSVTDSNAQLDQSAIGGSSSTSAFDLDISGTATTKFQSSVTVSMAVELPSGANNVRFYCIDTGDFVSASYDGTNVTGQLAHFSAWSIVYDEPSVVIVEDDDDILFILEQQKKAQEAASAQTTTGDNSGEEAAIIIAAAAVAGAMLACAFFAFRRN